MKMERMISWSEKLIMEEAVRRDTKKPFQACGPGTRGTFDGEETGYASRTILEEYRDRLLQLQDP